MCSINPCQFPSDFDIQCTKGKSDLMVVLGERLEDLGTIKVGLCNFCN